MRTDLRILRRALLLGAWLFTNLPPAPGEDTGSEIARLRAEIQALDQRLRDLEDRRAPAQKTDAAARAPAFVSAGTDGFSLGTADRDYLLRIRGVIHADGRFHLSEGADDTFLVRRVRPIFDLTLARDFSARIMPDFAGSSTMLVDAYAGYRFGPRLNVQVGKFKVPFDIERWMSQTDLLFVERSFTSALGPNRDVGIHVFGAIADGALTYNLAWVDGTTDGGTSIADSDNAKELVARLLAEPFKNSDSLLSGLGLGVAMTLGDKDGGAPSGYRTNAQQTFFSWASGVMSTGTQTRVEPQAYFHHGAFGLLGAWASSEQTVTLGANRATLQNQGWFIAANYVLTGEKTGLRAVTPAKDFDPSAGGWGAWELAVRFGELDIDDNAFPLFANPVTAATRISGRTIGLNWYLNHNVKLVLNWEHSRFDHDPAGPTARDDEDAVLTRVQLRF